MKQALSRVLKRMWGGWDEFFFAPVSPLPLGVFRFVYGLIALSMYSLRALDWKFYFTNAGTVPSDHAFDILPPFYQPSFALFSSSTEMTFVFQMVFLLSLLLMTVGLFSRIASPIAFFLHVSFLQRNYGVAYGADFISTFLFLTLALSDNARAFSLQSWWQKRKGRVGSKPSDLSQLLTSTSIRLLQIQMCVVYAVTGMEKLKGMSWWEGTAVWAVIGNPQLLLIDLSWLKHFPLAIAAMTFSTLLFEIYFAPLVWVKPLRKWILAMGVCLHAGIAVTVGLFFFSMVMVSTYLVFLDERDFEGCFRYAKKLGLPFSISQN